MGTTADKLNLLLNSKADIKDALYEMGRAPSDVFSTYADEIRAILDTHTVTLATPSISVSAVGKITATIEQPKGYVSGGTTTETYSLPTSSGGTFTPTTERQKIATYGSYVTADISIAGDADLVPANIIEGVSIFGVTGTTPTAESVINGVLGGSY